jgi:hypothetical protein
MLDVLFLRFSGAPGLSHSASEAIVLTCLQHYHMGDDIIVCCQS